MKWILITLSLVSIVLVNLLIASLMFPSKVQPIVVTAIEGYTTCDGSPCNEESLVLISDVATAAPSEASTARQSYEFMPSYYGCSHGYWAQSKNFHSWIGLRPTQNLESAFDIPDSYGLDNISLEEALSFRDGESTSATARTLLKEATTALLNSANPEIVYPLAMAEVIQEVNAALASESSDLMLLLAYQLQNYNHNGCPLR
jgi:hypothetical protein